MPDKTYLGKFLARSLADQHLYAAKVEVHGQRLAFIDSKGKLGLFLLEIVQSWNELPN